MLFAVQSKDIDRESWWIRPLLEKFDAATDFAATPDDVLDQARRAEAQIWGYYDGEFRGVVATQIRKSGKGSMLVIWICFGVDVRELIEDAYQEIEDWARSIGCRRVQIVGRKGWEKVLEGFESRAVVLEKRL